MSDTRQQLHSVSDLYAADEIEVLLLEEIRELEPPPSAYSRPEDIQDFEIAGSRTGGRTSSQSSELESPGIHSTVHSWDSHANYHGHYDRDHNGHGSGSNPAPWPAASQLVLYCDLQGHLRTATGVIRLMLLISSAACLVTLCSSGTAKVSLFMLPLVGRLRLMIFVAVFCLLVTSLLLFLDVSHVIYLFPFNWAKLNAWMFAGMGLSYVTGSALLVCSVWEYSGGSSGNGWVPRRTRSQLAVAAGLGLACALLALLLSWLHLRSSTNSKGHGSHSHTPTQFYRPVENSSSSGVTLKERSPKRPPPWVVKNQQQLEKANANSDSKSGNGNNKFKTGINKKDHWASAKQHFLPSQEDEEEEENRVSREEKEKDRRRRRRKNGTGSSAGVGGGGSSDNNDYGVSGGEAGCTGLGVLPAKTRCVPKKLPLKTLNNGSQQKQSALAMGETARSKQIGVKTLVNSDFKNYWETDNPHRNELPNNSSRWINQGVTASEIIDTDGSKIVLPPGWASQWQPTVDDVQPCSSKALDPYPFP